MANFDSNGAERSQRNWFNSKDKFSKEKTVLVSCVIDGFGAVKAEKLIDEIESKCGIGSVVACVMKNGVGFEVVFRERQLMEPILGELNLDGKICNVNELEAKFKYVSILNLSMYVSDEEIIDRFSKIGVEVVSPIKKHRMKSKINVYDGTRIFKAKLPPNMVAIPYSMKFSVNEKETAYYRVIHNQQVKVCSGCFSPEHMHKDCPEFICFECGEQGHISRKCLKNKCSFCFHKKDKCNCGVRKELHIDNTYSPLSQMESLQETMSRDNIAKKGDVKDSKECDENIDYIDENCNVKENSCTNVDDMTDQNESTPVDQNGNAKVNDDASHYSEDAGKVVSRGSALGVANLSTVELGDDGSGDDIDDECFEMEDDVIDDCECDEKVKADTSTKQDNVVLNNCNTQSIEFVKSSVEFSAENILKDDVKSDRLVVDGIVSSLEQDKSSQEGVRYSYDSLDEISMDTFPLTNECLGASGDDFTVVEKKKKYLGIKRRSKLKVTPNIKAAKLSNVQKKFGK